MYEKYLTYCLDMEDSHTELLSLKEDKGTAFFEFMMVMEVGATQYH